MKRKHLLSLLLGLLVILGLGMSYFILYDMTTFERLIGIEERFTQEVVESDRTVIRQDVPFTTTRQSYQEMMAPQRIYNYRNGQAYAIQAPRAINTITSLMASRPILIDQELSDINVGTINYLLNIDHLQLVFETRIPIGSLEHYIQFDEMIDENFMIDRVIIPLIAEEERAVYLADSSNNGYMVGRLSDSLTLDELRAATELDQDQHIPVARYNGLAGPIYMPVEPVSISSQYFTLQLVPESLFISQIFPDLTNITPVEVPLAQEQQILRYQNYLNTLDINRTSQRLSLTINRVTPGEPRSNSEKLVNAYRMVQDMEYWSQDVHLERYNNNYLDFRKYYEAYPIHTASTVVDHGRTTVQLRNDLSGDIYRYQQGMLRDYIHVETMSQSIALPNADDIAALLEQHDLAITDFTDIFIAYEWMPDTENYRKVELIPTYFFQIENNYYALSEVRANDFRQRIEGNEN